jgi:hypothetical protein
VTPAVVLRVGVVSGLLALVMIGVLVLGLA